MLDIGTLGTLCGRAATHQVLRKTISFLLVQDYDERLPEGPARGVASALVERADANRDRWLRREPVVGRVVATDLEWFFLRAKLEGGSGDSLALFEGWENRGAATRI